MQMTENLILSIHCKTYIFSQNNVLAYYFFYDITVILVNTKSFLT